MRLTDADLERAAGACERWPQGVDGRRFFSDARHLKRMSAEIRLREDPAAAGYG